jgi:chlorophyll synthase
MTLNDFKAIEGDRRMGIASLPVQLGPRRAAVVASLTMASAQLVVVALLLAWGHPIHAAAIAALLGVQLLMMRRFIAAPVARALWYSGFGVPLFVAGMMVSAFALRG